MCVYALSYIRNLLDDYVAAAFPEGSSHKNGRPYSLHGASLLELILSEIGMSEDPES